MHAEIDEPGPRGTLFAALGSLYFIWGSTFLAIRFALEGGFPPLLLAATRFLLAGLILFSVLRLRGLPNPSLVEWRSGLVMGVLLCGANGLVVLAERSVSSGMTAVTLASTPLWVALISGLFGRWPSGRDFIGLAIGFAGVALLQSGAELRQTPLGAILLLSSAVSWSFGSVISQRLPLAKGLMASATQMTAGGAVLLFGAIVRGERPSAMPSAAAWASLAYLVIFGSIIAYSAYNYVLAKARPAVATSYAYVNPIVAVALGALLASERFSANALVALALILGGVAVVMGFRLPAPGFRPKAKAKQERP